MYIHMVPRGTEFEFTFDDGTTIIGIFDGNIDHMSFRILCMEISRNIDIYHDSKPEAKFIVGENSYHFKSQLLGISEKKDAIHDSLEFQILTPFKAVALRQNFRIQINLKVRIHEYVDDYKKLYTNGWLCDAVSDDVSKNGIRLWCDHVLPDSVDSMYTLEFSIKQSWIYMIPAKLMRAAPNTATRSYHYDYGFNFDFSAMPDKQEKLLLDILEHKIKNRL